MYYHRCIFKSSFVELKNHAYTVDHSKKRKMQFLNCNTMTTKNISDELNFQEQIKPDRKVGRDEV